MSRTVTTTVHNFCGIGPTITAAREDASKRLTKALAGDYTPRYFDWRGNAVVVWRCPYNGWSYSIARDRDRGSRLGPIPCTSSSSGELADAMRSALAHLAQMGQRASDPQAPLFVVNPEDRDEYCRRSRFMRRYQAALDAGLSEDDASDYAGQNPAKPDLWKDKFYPEPRTITPSDLLP